MATKKLTINVEVNAQGAVRSLRGVEGGIKGVTDASGRATQATAQFTTAKSRLNEFLGTTVGKVAALTAGYLTLTTAWRTLSGFVSSSINDFAAQEAATSKLTAALQAQGNFTPELITSYQALASEFQRTTVFGDELLLEMQALLTQVGSVGPRQMGAALKAATDLSAGLGVDLRTSTLLVAKAFAGHTSELTRYGIVIDKATLQSQGINAVLASINDKFGGQAQAQIETYTGRVAQLSNAWSDLKEEFGANIASSGILETAMTALKTTVEANTAVYARTRTEIDLAREAMAGNREAAIQLRESWEVLGPAGEIVARTLESLTIRAQSLVIAAAPLPAALTDAATALREFDAANSQAEQALRKHLTAAESLRLELIGQPIVERVEALTAAWLLLTPAEQDNGLVVGRLMAMYAGLRGQVESLPPALEAVFLKLQAFKREALSLIPLFGPGGLVPPVFGREFIGAPLGIEPPPLVTGPLAGVGAVPPPGAGGGTTGGGGTFPGPTTGGPGGAVFGGFPFSVTNRDLFGRPAISPFLSGAPRATSNVTINNVVNAQGAMFEDARSLDRLAALIEERLGRRLGRQLGLGLT